MVLRAIGFAKIPLLGLCSPRVRELNERRCVVSIPLRRMTKNHLGSMYFGALSIGADCAGGMIAVEQIQKKFGRGGMKKVALVFKDFQAEFHKRAEGEVHFTCEDGELISRMLEETLRTGERVTEGVQVIATVPRLSGNEPVATFKLGLSLKRR
ncbi:MAG: DUF4442 domain-containing protein [Bacteriovoracia bacterium]